MSQEQLLSGGPQGGTREAGPAVPESPVEAVLDQALAWLGRWVGFDAARALAYDPAVLIPVSIATSQPLESEYVMAACRNEQAEADVHKFGDLARSRLHVAVMTAESPGQAASLWLSGSGELLFATPTGREWLDCLRTSEMPGRAETVLAGLAVSVAASAARSGQAGPPRPVSVRARGGQGQWIALHGETITGPDGKAQGISVVIGPARPATVLPILAAAYGLTGREQDVIRSVFAGHSTKEISTRLAISTYTVQDHLKSIFGKVGVTSRGELAHHLALQFT